MKSKSKKLFFNTIIFFIGNFGAKIIQFLLVPLYTYTLTTEEYGIVELVLTTISFCIPIFSIQISDALLRFGLDKDYNKKDVLKVAFRILNIGSLVLLITIPFFRINSIIRTWSMYFFIILNLRMYRDIFSINLKINEKNRLYAIDSILFTLVLCVSNIVYLVVFKKGIAGYFNSYIIANALSIIFLLIVGNIKKDVYFGKCDKNLFKELVLYSIPMIVNSISWWITNASDKYMIKWIMSEAEVGIYAVATKIPTFLTTFIGIFNQAWIISAISEYNDKEGNNDFYSEIYEKFIEISFISACALILIVEPFMKLYVSSSFFIAWKYVPFLILGAIFSGICSFFASIYYAYKKNINVTITTVIGACVNIVLNFFLIKKIGIMGAAVSTAFSWLLIVVFRVLFIKHFVDFKLYKKKLIINIVYLLIEIIAIVYMVEIYRFIVGLLILVLVLINNKTILKDVAYKSKKIICGVKHG